MQTLAPVQSMTGENLVKPNAIATLMYSKVRNWFRIRANLAELNALDNRTLMDIGLSRNEFHAVANSDMAFERGATLHVTPTTAASGARRAR
jgi:uncharacterized protein YjiS (DUF1127 family)